jgi:hypothetical protein
VHVLDAVALAHVQELVAEGGAEDAGPGQDLLLEHRPDEQHRMDHQVLADVGVVQARADQQRGRVDRAGRNRHRAGADGELVPVHRRRLDALCLAALDQHPLDRSVDDDPGAGVVGVLQPRLEGRLLGAERTAVMALPADLLPAADRVALHHL